MADSKLTETKTPTATLSERAQETGGLPGGKAPAEHDVIQRNLEGVIRADEARRSYTPSITESRLSTHSKTSSRRTVLYENDENKQRGNWTGKLDFLLSMLGWSVGLGNVWRFPYKCYKYGGGAFLIPYTLTLIFVGIPLFFLEVSLAQFCSEGPLTCWGYAPLFKGIGVAMMLISGIVTIYYNMIIAWSLFYLFASFTSHLPWTDCTNWWNSEDCSDRLPMVNCSSSAFSLFKNGTCYFKNGTFHGLWNLTMFTNVTGRTRMLASAEYWNNRVLDIGDGVNDLGAPRWELVLNLLLAWIVCFFCLIKGIKSSGKVVYFTALFPYAVLIILFIRGLMLENAGEGIRFYVVPRWENLQNVEVWREAATQIFYSMGMGWGGLQALASYNRFHNNTLRDTLIVAIGGCLTSFFAGFVIFSYLGYMAKKLGVEVDEVAQVGTGLAFVVYPEAVTHMPAPTLWAILFFLMLITLGLDSQFVTVETVLTGFCDQMPSLRPKKTWIVLAICVVEFLLGLPFTTSAGAYLLQLVDGFIGVWALPIVCLLESISIGYVYGADRFYDDLRIMLGSTPNIWWKICWKGISPVGAGLILLFAWIFYTPHTYNKTYAYPPSAEAVGWIISLIPILGMVIFMVMKIYRERDVEGILAKLKVLTTPTRSWGPSLPEHRALVDYVSGFVLDPLTEKEQLAYSNPAFTESSASLGLADSLGSLSADRQPERRSLRNRQTDNQNNYLSSESVATVESSV